ncbi:MAG: hypothetical protein COU06_02245 [Candidatus Harrisonbacteria bacterium CG10_big_fil_rev_8_21_14_0_10_38_8]|uniref:Multidrug ABC transporter substrate-binding protein n=1 Tax=Candidatus Harrisonbacteria bacterium CG10_big_fil_rev_8_21_14_0_10_38_8 TaxID=1974582 RepID=A0A2M6WJQ9_9BACT|nr:MAG: hypothetical protein COU06_02245 [Candidatus Harrisonbacteria bacterium CG10_big_fil_rev_8_21_14_0_10_38_8]
MSFGVHLTTALSAVNKHKVRGFLTMLGIIIGISAYIFINAVGASAQALILDQIRKVGSNLIVILPGKSEANSPPAPVFYINITTLKESDRLDIESDIPSIIAATGYVRGTDTLSYGSKSRAIQYFGVTSNYLEVEEAEIKHGRFFTQDEDLRSSRVVVLGPDVADEFFGTVNPVGESIKIKGERYSIIGVFEERGATTFQNQDNVFVLPLKTAQKVLLGINHLSFIRAKVDRAENIDSAQLGVTQILRENHRIQDPENDDFTVNNTEDALGILTSVTDSLTLFLTIIGAISLLVGGIGIMNIMYVSVTERIYEIGLRKAIGAKKKDILYQFLTEAVLLTVIGGVIGIITGITISGLVAVGAKLLGYEWSFIVTTPSVIIAFSIAVLVGLIFGIYPAKRASELEPVDAIRYG